MKETVGKEQKWYEKAAGKRQHKAENVARLSAKGESKKRRTEKEEAFSPKGKKRKPFVPKLSVNIHADTKPMFSLSNVPKDARLILDNFGAIAAETMGLSGKQQTLLPGQIKKLSHQLTDDRGSRRVGYMNDASSVSAYISYFMWWNLVRLVRLFANLPGNAFPLKDGNACLDLGSGPLTVPIALWLARPELRAKKLVFYAVDLSQSALSAGEELYLSIAARTASSSQEPWKIVRVKGSVGTDIKEAASLVTCANVFNELSQTDTMQQDYLAKSYSGIIEKYFKREIEENTSQTVLVVEPGDPHSARLVSLMRDAFIRRGFMPVSPCPHTKDCPMQGRTSSNPSGKWCNFAFETDDAPASLLKFSQNAKLPKERAVLSYVLSRREHSVAKTAQDREETLALRVASDFIRLPELHKSGYYCCSDIGLVLAVDETGVHPKNGDLINTRRPAQGDISRDKKSKALIVRI